MVNMKKEWYNLKEDIIRQYVQSISEKNIEKQNILMNIGLQMDVLDKTCEFKNIYEDLKKISK